MANNVVEENSKKLLKTCSTCRWQDCRSELICSFLLKFNALPINPANSLTYQTLITHQTKHLSLKAPRVTETDQLAKSKLIIAVIILPSCEIRATLSAHLLKKSRE
jgi:hypothetical protein